MMVGYAAYVLSQFAGEAVTPVPLPNGGIAFIGEGGETMIETAPDDAAEHVH